MCVSISGNGLDLTMTVTVLDSTSVLNYIHSLNTECIASADGSFIKVTRKFSCSVKILAVVCQCKWVYAFNSID